MTTEVGTVYMIRNTVNNMVYIGSTTMKLEDRFKAHVNRVQTKNLSSTMSITEAIREFGESVFEVRALEENVPKSILHKQECMWIHMYMSDNPEHGYNKYTGDTPRKKKHLTEAQKIKHLESNRRWREQHRKEESERVLKYYYEKKRKANARQERLF